MKATPPQLGPGDAMPTKAWVSIGERFSVTSAYERSAFATNRNQRSCGTAVKLP